MDALPSFPLFPDPLREGCIKPSKKPCQIGRRSLGAIYLGPQYGPHDHDLDICPWCIADGSAAARGIQFNDCLDPLPQDQFMLATCRTPGFDTWQGNHWLACCDLACVYLGEADTEDLTGRWASAVPSMFDGLGFSAAEQRRTINSIDREGSPRAYVFHCRRCKSLRGYWDCE